MWPKGLRRTSGRVRPFLPPWRSSDPVGLQWRHLEGQDHGGGAGSSHGFHTSAGKQAPHWVIWGALNSFLPLGLVHITTQRHAELGGVMLALYPLTLL